MEKNEMSLGGREASTTQMGASLAVKCHAGCLFLGFWRLQRGRIMALGRHSQSSWETKKMSKKLMER